MGARGPQPTPTALLLARGSRKGRARVKAEVDSEVAAPPCPAFLGELAREEWDRIVPELLRRHTLSRADMSGLAIYCHAWGQFVELAEKVDESGYTTVSSEGAIVVHPLVTVLNKTVERLLKAADRFGLSPAAKARVKAIDVAAKQKQNPKARFFPDGGTGPRLAQGA